MPYLESNTLNTTGTFDPEPILILARDFQTRIKPNETQRNTLIVAGVYVVIIFILWCVLIGQTARYPDAKIYARHLPYLRVISE